LYLGVSGDKGEKKSEEREKGLPGEMRRFGEKLFHFTILLIRSPNLCAIAAYARAMQLQYSLHEILTHEIPCINTDSTNRDSYIVWWINSSVWVMNK